MDEKRQPFLEHLGELRLRLRNAVLALIVGCIIAFWFSETLFALLARPLNQAWHEVLPDRTANLSFGSLVEPFWVYFELSMYAGLFIASPFIFHQLWKFIAPGLYDKEKKVAVPFEPVRISPDTIASRPGTDTVNKAVAPATRRPSGPVTVTVNVTFRGSLLALKR